MLIGLTTKSKGENSLSTFANALRPAPTVVKAMVDNTADKHFTVYPSSRKATVDKQFTVYGEFIVTVIFCKVISHSTFHIPCPACLACPP
jgi:hypothetical protein